MAQVTITFKECLQDSQSLGSDDDHMVSQVRFDVTGVGQAFNDRWARVKQVVGGHIADPLEVFGPKSGGPYGYAGFRDAVEQYFRKCVGPQGSGIRISGGSNIRMRDNRFVIRSVVTITIPDLDAAGW